jgi:AMME syndrome candidate gene 1 protein
VSLLKNFRAASSWDDWAVGTHGLIIDFTDPHDGARRSATFLPEVAEQQGWARGETIEHLVKKVRPCCCSSCVLFCGLCLIL